MPVEKRDPRRSRPSAAHGSRSLASQAGLLIALGVATPAVVTFAPRVASAQTSAGSSEEAARAAFADGLRIRDELRRPTDALAKFADAYRLAPTAITAFELGKTHMMLGQLLEAQRLFVTIGEMPPDPLQSQRGKSARADAKRLSVDLDSKIPSIAVRIDRVPAGETPPRVSIDGKPVDPAKQAMPQRVNPGEHKVSIAARDGEQSRTVTILEGNVIQVVFELGASPPAAKLVLPSRRTIGMIVAGVGAVGVGVSLILGVSAYSKNRTARDEHCGGAVGGETETQCDFRGYQDIKSAGSQADVATALFIIGGAALATGTFLWVTAPPASDNKTRVGLAAGPGSLFLKGKF